MSREAATTSLRAEPSTLAARAIARSVEIAADFEPLGAGFMRCRHCPGWRPLHPTAHSLDLHWRSASHQAARRGEAALGPRPQRAAGVSREAGTTSVHAASRHAAAIRERLRADLLVQLGQRPLTTSRALARALDCSQSTVDRLLRALAIDGLVASSTVCEARGHVASQQVKCWKLIRCAPRLKTS